MGGKVDVKNSEVVVGVLNVPRFQIYQNPIDTGINVVSTQIFLKDVTTFTRLRRDR